MPSVTIGSKSFIDREQLNEKIYLTNSRNSYRKSVIQFEKNKRIELAGSCSNKINGAWCLRTFVLTDSHIHSIRFILTSSFSHTGFYALFFTHAHLLQTSFHLHFFCTQDFTDTRSPTQAFSHT